MAEDVSRGAVEDRRLPGTPRPLRLCLFGAAGDTGNLGVSALMHSCLGGVSRFAPDAAFTVFDNGWGVRPAVARFGEREFAYTRSGARMSRRYHRPESFLNMRVSAALGGLRNPGARTILDADAVWDISGGDSFGEIYGQRHLVAIAEPKRLAPRLHKPLILMPQTYGPFPTREWRDEAARMLRESELAWARDERSFDVMKELLGHAFDARRHRVGVDVAFALERTRPEHLDERLADWFERHDRPVVGINVSGLLYNDPDARERFDLGLDYGELIRGLVGRFLSETDARIVLVSHVIPTEVHAESDLVAARDVVRRFEAQQDRIAVLGEGLEPTEIKWVMAQLDWFSGARMHATIGAMSSLVPTAGLAYSLKMQGVFESCGQGESMADMRGATADAVAATVWRSWEERARAKSLLEEHVPAVRDRALEELFETLEVTAHAVAG